MKPIFHCSLYPNPQFSVAPHHNYILMYCVSELVQVLWSETSQVSKFSE